MYSPDWNIYLHIFLFNYYRFTISCLNSFCLKQRCHIGQSSSNFTSFSTIWWFTSNTDFWLHYSFKHFNKQKIHRVAKFTWTLNSEKATHKTECGILTHCCRLISIFWSLLIWRLATMNTKSCLLAFSC